MQNSRNFPLPPKLQSKTRQTCPVAGFSSFTGVGAILLLFLSWFPSSLSLSLASRLIPLTLPDVLPGVCGGVDMGIPPTKPTLPAVTPGTLLPTKVGLLMIAPGA